MENSGLDSGGLLSLIDEMSPAGDPAWGDIRELVARDFESEGPAAALNRLLCEGLRRLRGLGTDAREQIQRFVDHVFSIATDLGIDAAKLTKSMIEMMCDEGLIAVASSPAERDRTKRDTRRRILDAAVEVFSTEGFQGATMEQIAEAAGLGKGTLYRYFPTKEELYRAIVTGKFDDLISRARAVARRSSDILDVIRETTRMYLEFFEEDKALYRILLRDRPDFEREMKGQFAERALEHVPILAEKIRTAVAAGRLKSVNFYTAFYGYLGYIQGVVDKWIRNECRKSLVAELDEIVEVLFYGLAAKGPKE